MVFIAKDPVLAQYETLLDELLTELDQLIASPDPVRFREWANRLPALKPFLEDAEVRSRLTLAERHPNPHH